MSTGSPVLWDTSAHLTKHCGCQVMVATTWGLTLIASETGWWQVLLEKELLDSGYCKSLQDAQRKAQAAVKVLHST